MLAEQITQRKRNVRRRRNAYHAPANMTEMQQNIAAVTLNHVRQGKAVDWRNLALTYPLAFDLTWQALGETERAESGVACPSERLRQRTREREQERIDQLKAFGRIG